MTSDNAPSEPNDAAGVFIYRSKREMSDFENAAREQASRRPFGDLSPDQQEHLMAVWWMDLPPHHELEPLTESPEAEEHLLELFRHSLFMGSKVDTKRLVRQIRAAIFDYLYPIVEEAYEAAMVVPDPANRSTTICPGSVKNHSRLRITCGGKAPK